MFFKISAHLSIDVGVLSVADHVGALLQILVHRLRCRAQVRRHARFQNPLNNNSTWRDCSSLTFSPKSIFLSRRLIQIQGRNLPREDLNLLGGSGNAGDLGLVTRVRDQLDCEVEHQTVGIVLR